MSKLSKEDKAEIQLGREMQMMMATKGWAHFVRLMNYHIEQKKRAVLQPFSSVQDLKAQQSVLFSALDCFLTSAEDKGAIMGLTLARDLPSGIVQTMETLLAQVKSDDELGDDE